MTYAARQDLVDRFGADEIDDLAPESGQRADAALADAAAEIDAMLAAAYDLPLDGAFPALTAAACDVARLRLYDDAVPAEAVLARATRARARVRDIVEGAAALVDAAGRIAARRVEAGAPLGAATNVTDRSPELTRERLRAY